MFRFTSSEISHFAYVVKSGATEENPNRYGYLASFINVNILMSLAPATIEL